MSCIKRACGCLMRADRRGFEMFDFFSVLGVLVLLVYFLVRGRRPKRRSPSRHRQPTSQRRVPPKQVVERQDTFPFLDVPTMMERGDWDGARRALQKIAYEFVNKPPSEKRKFTELMVEFARQDPLYNRCIVAITPLVQAKPGIKQTALYPHMPTADIEESRYVLYFADELGDIVRRKKGNSYEVFPPGHPLPEVPIKPKRSQSGH